MHATLTPFPDFPASALSGPLREPRQMLAEQSYDGHLSIHDDATAGELGLSAGPIEGPTHFSQFDPLLFGLFGQDWFETGCISVHYQNMVVEGESVRAFVQPPADGQRVAQIWAEKRDGTPVLKGTASVGNVPDGEHEIPKRIAKLRPSTGLVINHDLKVGQRGAQAETITMGFEQHMGAYYPFSLADKLKVITEPSPWYTPEGGTQSPWRRAIVPMEMISVLLGSTVKLAGFSGRGPAVGLFAGQQIRLLKGPLFVGQAYGLQREIIALSESARTESAWVRTRVFEPGTQEPVAEMILNSATLKNSYANYEADARTLGLTP
ncbi:hypothetical protein [Hydrogenophaga sp. PAMC20947]|uniref:hypothetical protein n=1 Tax=Hydrogenophaga sp. PAMC20947 TaxID=2565558 RepID=UPI00109E1CCF|nr:hypothetical protein [Hydrogenophaga sp. PAMC20947]QCB45896.1 hypothetical protein E5678_07620 [Hydrogenophaga sp. PAMC20947]